MCLIAHLVHTSEPVVMSSVTETGERVTSHVLENDSFKNRREETVLTKSERV